MKLKLHTQCASVSPLQGCTKITVLADVTHMLKEWSSDETENLKSIGREMRLNITEHILKITGIKTIINRDNPKTSAGETEAV